MPSRSLAAMIVVILILRSHVMTVVLSLVSMRFHVRTGCSLSAIHVTPVSLFHDPAAAPRAFVMLNGIPSHFTTVGVLVMMIPVLGVLGKLSALALQRTFRVQRMF